MCEIFSNHLTQKHRALSSGCSGRVPRPYDATEARQSDRARSKTRSRPPIRGLDGTSLRVVVVARGLRRSEWRRK